MSTLVPNSFSSKCASFSQEMNTSPWLRCAKVTDEPLAPESSTGTLANSLVTNSLALASLPYLRLANSQAAK